jgi:hypothetical protein
MLLSTVSEQYFETPYLSDRTRGSLSLFLPNYRYRQDLGADHDGGVTISEVQAGAGAEAEAAQLCGPRESAIEDFWRGGRPGAARNRISFSESRFCFFAAATIPSLSPASNVWWSQADHDPRSIAPKWCHSPCHAWRKPPLLTTDACSGHVHYAAKSEHREGCVL